MCSIALLLLGACAAPRGENEASGMIIGRILGGVLGHQVGNGSGQTAATLIGAMIGTTIGGNVGKSMDKTDRLKVSYSLEMVRTGVEKSWKNPDTGYKYRVVPTRTYELAKGSCREYAMDASIGGKNEKIYGTACRQADGSWKVKD
jgi:surface antigen